MNIKAVNEKVTKYEIYVDEKGRWHVDAHFPSGAGAVIHNIICTTYSAYDAVNDLAKGLES